MKKFFLSLAVLAGLMGALGAEQIEITADSFEADENKLIGKLDGNVVIKNGSFDKLTSDHARVLFDEKKQAKKYIASGNAKFWIKLKGKDYDGGGAELTYEPAEQIYTLSGNAYLHEVETDKKLYGAKIVVNKAKGIYSVYGQDNQPVKFIFETEVKK